MSLAEQKATDIALWQQKQWIINQISDYNHSLERLEKERAKNGPPRFQNATGLQLVERDLELVL